VEPESSRRVFDGKLIHVDVEQGPSGERVVVNHPRGCVLLSPTRGGDMLLVKQFR